MFNITLLNNMVLNETQFIFKLYFNYLKQGNLFKNIVEKNAKFSYIKLKLSLHYNVKLPKESSRIHTSDTDT